MDIYKSKWTSLQEEIFALLCMRAGERLSQREIAKILKVSPTAIGNSLDRLKSENLVKIEKTKTINFISFNRDERKAVELKRVYNLKNIYLSGLSDYLHDELPGTAIILFGSYSRGEDTDGSDIDLAVIGSRNKEFKLEKFENSLRRKININFYDSWQNIHKYLKDSILNGIVLSGGIEL